MKSKRRIVLAYSGGLDTSIILKWLQENYEAEVIAYTADIGQKIDKKKIIRNAKKLGVKKIIIENNPPFLGFTVVDNTLNLNRLQCFASRQSKPSIVKILPGNRVEIRFQEKFRTGRNRVNCTLPAKNNRWRWLGFQLISNNSP